jgi:demethylmenaquinone methyltransferase/2-methoxy-6-polyprenyl-1,4-benzoquinol methylase
MNREALDSAKALRVRNADMPQKSETPAMFSKIAERYDLLNRVLSLGIDKSWRAALVKSAGVTGSVRILDACTGTADVAIGFARAFPSCSVVGIDLSGAMLAVGQRKVAGMRLENRISLRIGDALAIPFPDAEFDVVSIAFGLRNLPDYRRGILEMTRVLKPGGKLLILEFSAPTRGLFLKSYQVYLRRVVPAIGSVVSGSRVAYRYLASSIGEFLTNDAIMEHMRAAELTAVRERKLAGGIARIFRGERP